MSHEPDPDALERFARDLRRIREDREVPLGTLQGAIQVSESQLQSFEAGALYEKSKMNPVYLRAFVRAYAEAVGIPPDSVVTHLESALEGQYRNQLAIEHLDVPPSEAEKDPPSSPAGAPSSTGDEEEAPETSQDISSDHSSREAERAEGSAGDSSPGAASGEERSSSSEQEKPERASEEKSAEEEQPVDSPASAGSTASPGVPEASGTFNLATSRRMLLVAAGSLILIFGVVGWGLELFSEGNDPASEPTIQTETSADQGASDVIAPADTGNASRSPEQPPSADVTIGDTLYVTVLATSDVRELRVQQDDHLRRPYWIEDGEAMVFPFTRRIALQNHLDSLRLLLEQYPYPSSRTDAEGRVVITRDMAEQFADTLRGAPLSVPVSPDTVLGTGPT